MKKHLTHQDISAYIDGEHRKMNHVQRHLQQCAECAQRHVAMSKLSTHVSTLTTPELSDAFATRVLREIERREEPSRSWGLRLSFPMIAVAASLVLVAAIAWRTSTPQPQDHGSALASNNVPVVVGTISDTLLATDELDAFSEDDYFHAMIEPDVSSENVMLALAGADLFANVSPDWLGGNNFHATVSELSDDERETLMVLLSSYVISEKTL